MPDSLCGWLSTNISTENPWESNTVNSGLASRSPPKMTQFRFLNPHFTVPTRDHTSIHDVWVSNINSTCPLTILFSSVQGIFSGAMLAIYVYIHILRIIYPQILYCNVSNSANEDFHTWSLLFSVRRSLFTLHQGFFKESLQCLAVQKDTDQPKKTHPQTHWPMISAWPMFFRLSQNATKVGLIFCFGKKVRHVRSPHVIGLVDFF